MSNNANVAANIEDGSNRLTLDKFVEKLENGEINAKEQTLRQQIIAIYPRLRQLMQDKHLSRAELYKQFKEHFKQIDENGNETVITEKTFFNYLGAGKLAMDKELKKQARKTRESNKNAEQAESKATQPEKPAETAPVIETAPKSGNEYMKQAQQAHTVKTEAQKPNVDMPIFAEDEKN